MKLTHINKKNNLTMVDVSNKIPTAREAIASGEIAMNEAAFNALKQNSTKKGAIIDTAIVAAIMGAKKTSDLIPACHPLFLSKIDCEINLDEKNLSAKFSAKIKCEGKTGVEMEALSAVSIGLLTIYDMLKAIDKSMCIKNIVLERKSGGKSGDWRRKNN